LHRHGCSPVGPGSREQNFAEARPERQVKVTRRGMRQCREDRKKQTGERCAKA